MASYDVLVPRPQRVEPLSGKFTFTAGTHLLIHDPTAPSQERHAASEIRETVRRLTGLHLQIASWTTTPTTNSIVLGRMEAPPAYRAAFLPLAQRKGVTDATFSASGVFAPSANHAEDYLVYNTQPHGFVLLAGRTQKGVFHGAQTLIQLCQQLLTPAQLGLDRAKIHDYPRLAVRSTSIAVAPQQRIPPDAQMQERLRYFASLKINTVMIGANWFSPDEVAQVKELFDLCRWYGLNPMPAAGYYGWSHPLLDQEPRVFEGRFRQARFRFPDSDQDLVARPMTVLPEEWKLVIQTPAALKLTDTLTNAPYLYDRDYTITPNGLEFSWNGGRPAFTTNGTVPQLVRLTTGGIARNRPVTLSYSAAVTNPASPRQPYCPYEPLVLATLRPIYQRIVETLRPEMIHLGCDEVTRFSSCSRCKGRHPSAIMAKAITDLFNLVSELDPNIRCLFWADMLNPYDSALTSVPHTSWEAIKKIPRNPRLILVPWAYEEGYRAVQGPGWPAGEEPNLVNFIKNTYALFDNVEGFSFQCIGTVAAERLQTTHWWCRMSAGKRNVLGLLHPVWGGSPFPLGHDGWPQYNGLVATAAFGWTGASSPNLAGEDWPPYERLHSPYYGANWQIQKPAALEFAEINFRYGEYLRPWTVFAFKHAWNALGWMAGRDVKAVLVPPDSDPPGLFVHVIGTNPMIESPDWLRIPAVEYGVVEISMQLWHGGQGRIFFTTEDQPDFSDAKGAGFPLQPGPEPRVYRIEMGRVPGWQGIIRRLRLEPFQTLAPVEAGVAVHWIKVLPD